MHFYRMLQSIKAVSFDLDDTLYDNGTVMVRAEHAFFEHLRRVPYLATIEPEHLIQAKKVVREQQPDIFHDVVAWREQTLNFILMQVGVDRDKRDQLIHAAMDVFVTFRHQIDVPSETHRILSLLAKKMPIVSISNGNVDIQKINLGHYFQFSLRGGVDGFSKPYPDLFERAAKMLDLSPSEILHVGDNLHTDVLGAIQSGMQACWLNLSDITLYKHPDARVLPHVEINNLSEIECLLCH